MNIGSPTRARTVVSLRGSRESARADIAAAGAYQIRMDARSRRAAEGEISNLAQRNLPEISEEYCGNGTVLGVRRAQVVWPYSQSIDLTRSSRPRSRCGA